MIVLTESALRILIPRRNLHGSLRAVTRQLIHRSIGLIRDELRTACDAAARQRSQRSATRR